MCVDLMDSLGLEPLWTAMAPMGGMPMVDDQWDPTSYSTEGSLVTIRDLNFGPMVAMAIETDIFNTSRKLITVRLTTGVTRLAGSG